MFFRKKTLPLTTKIQTQALPGFIELLPSDQILFNDFKAKIIEAYESFGFLPIETPLIEREEVLLAKVGGETEKEIYKIKKGDNNLALRFDLTVPLARYVSEHYHDLVFPFKRYHVGKVYRGERPQKGRYREFYQCDVDIINENELSLQSDAEVLSLIYETFSKLKIGPFRLEINNRKILFGLLENLDLSKKEKEVLRILDKKGKISDQETVELLEKEKIDTGKIEALLKILNFEGSTFEIVEFLKNQNISNETFLTGVTELEEVLISLEVLGVPTHFFKVNLFIIRGLDYYTGTVFETFLLDNLDLGSISSGGRYEKLTENYLDKKLMGVGASIGLSRLFIELKTRGLIKSLKKTTSQVIIIPLTENLIEVGKVAKILREQEIKTEIYLEKSSMKKKLNYANKQEAPFVILLGDEEISEKKFTLKNMNSGEQEKLPIEEIVEKIKINDAL